METSRDSKSRNGQILVLFVAAAVVLLAVAALVIDVGGLFVSKAGLQNAADAASNAGVLELWSARAAGSSEESARAAAQVEVERMTQLNYPEAGAEAEFGIWRDDAFLVRDHLVPANAVRVRTFRNESAPGGPDRTFFAGVLGIGEVDQAANATARYAHPALIPFSIFEDDAFDNVGGPPVTFLNQEPVAPGVFGLIDFNGGAHADTDLRYWTEYGYDGPFDVDPDTGHIIVEGNTGWHGSLKPYVQAHIDSGEEVVGLIYGAISGQAADTIFDIVGFCTMVMTGITNHDISARITGVHVVGSGSTAGEMHDFMVLQIVE